MKLPIEDKLDVTGTLLFPRMEQVRTLRWHPATDIFREENSWLVKVELAGVRFEDLEVQIEGSKLILQGCRRDRYLGHKIEYHQLEISYHRFERIIQMPCTLKKFQMSVDYQDGMLLLRLEPKEETI